MSVQRAVDRLKEESEEISKALGEFLKERDEVATSQQIALDNYNLELLEIGDITQMEEEMFEFDNPVDHNLLRHLNVSIKSSDEPVEQMNVESDNLERRSTKSKKKEPKVQIKMEMPGPEAKIDIRVEMFKFLDKTKEEESQLEEKVISAKEKDEEEAFIASMLLYKVQRQNYEKLMEFIELYQPAPFSRAWGNDPEYIDLCRKYSGAYDNSNNKTNKNSGSKIKKSKRGIHKNK